MPDSFSLDCRDCPRLAGFDRVRRDHPDYHAPLVLAFGDAAAELLIVGLAPGMHGRTAPGGHLPAIMPASCSTALV